MSMRPFQRLLTCFAILFFFLTSVIAANAESINYVHDGMNRLIKVVYGDGSWIEYIYDANGNRIGETVSPITDSIPPATTASPTGGMFASVQSVSLSCSDGAGSGCDKIYYTTDGSTPTWASTVYVSPISISLNTTLKYFAKDQANNSESVKTQTYIIDNTAPTVIATPAGGTYSSAQSVTLTCNDGEGVGCGQIYYTTDDSIPTTDSPLYSGPISIPNSSTLNCFAIDILGNIGPVQTESYAIRGTLTILKNGPGEGTVTSNPTGIDCGSNCSMQFESGTSVFLTAIPINPSSIFTGWSGEGCSGTPACSVIMDGDKTITATFFGNSPPIARIGVDQLVHPGSLVTLDGSGSSDPDGNYPLTYTWEIIEKPVGSPAVLSDPSAVNPSFRADLLGDYLVKLVVTDNLGLPSTPDQKTIGTSNSAPVAEAGNDQSIATIGSTVQLNGTTSYDPDGDPIYYSWTIKTKPSGSIATLWGPSSATPSFVADIHGDYVIGLVITDIFGAVSPEDTVRISFSNLKPVANAGGNQSVMAGQTITLNGGGSSDANNDPLTYFWSIVSQPTGSAATLNNPTSVTTSFVADKPGIYVIGLVVNDGLENSDPSNVIVTAITREGIVIENLNSANQKINSLDLTAFKNPNMRNALTNKINAVLQMLEQDNYQNALDKLENDLLKKTDGCVLSGAPDNNDWILNCTSQGQVYPLLLNAIEILRGMI